MAMLMDGSADAMWVYADQAHNYDCTAAGAGVTPSWNCTLDRPWYFVCLHPYWFVRARGQWDHPGHFQEGFRAQQHYQPLPSPVHANTRLLQRLQYTRLGQQLLLEQLLPDQQCCHAYVGDTNEPVDYDLR